MSEPKRLEFIKSDNCDMGCDCRLIPDPIQCKDGRFVFYSDYARLKAEVERLTIERNGFEQAMKANQSILETKRDENERLRNLAIKLDGYVDLVRHENNRLRKAGDWMREALEEGPIDYQCRIDRCNAAKEGRPSV